MANKLIRDITNTTVLPAANDYLAADGATSETSKTLATNFARQFPTRAALIAADTTSAGDGQVVLVQGNLAAGDGGGGLYYFDSASVAAPNGTTILQPTTGPGRWLAAPFSAASFMSGLGTAAFQNVGAFAQAANNLSDLASKATAKNNLNLIQVNVRDYGAVGDGTADDSVAINAAIAALPASHGWLYFPPGKYRINGGLTNLANKSFLEVSGNGAEIYNTTNGNTLVFEPSCANITVRDTAFTGNSVVRANGIHIRCHADNTYITNCYFQGCSDFGVFIGHEDTSNVTVNVYVEGNIFKETLGDGVHVMNAENVVIADNVFRDTGDDAIGIVADYPARRPRRVTVVGNQIYSPASRGIAVLEAEDILVDGNQIHDSAAAGIEIGRYTSTSFYNARIKVTNNALYNCISGGAGPRGAIWLQFIQQGLCASNQIIDPVNGSGITFLDINECAISGNLLRGCPSRGIASDDSTTANVGATWFQIFITNNVVDYVLANEGIYVVPAVGKLIQNFLVTGNSGAVILGGTFIYYNRVDTGRVGNNTNLGGSITAGGSVAATTAFNNN